MKRLALVLIVLLAALQYRLWKGDGGVGEMHQLKDRIQVQLTQNQLLSQRNQGMYAEIRDLRSGFEAIEERARNELGMIKEGETFFRIIDTP